MWHSAHHMLSDLLCIIDLQACACSAAAAEDSWLLQQLMQSLSPSRTWHKRLLVW